jgi:FKBP-type peptidyl-prolyl cis-trans isomerase SlyD
MSTKVISFNCTLKTKAGVVINTSLNREVVANSEASLSLDWLVNSLKSLKLGEKTEISLEAEKAYGVYDPSKVILFPRVKINTRANIGDTVKITGKSGTVRSYKVINNHHDMFTLDGNHPLAGVDIVFEVEALKARVATPAEMTKAPICLQALYQ